MKPTVLILVLVVSVLVIWGLTRGGVESAAAEPGQDGFEPAVASPKEAGPSEFDSGDEAADPSMVREVGSEVEPEEQEGVAVLDSNAQMVRGRLELLDEFGRIQAPPSGELPMTLWRGNGGVGEDALLVDGEFALEIPEGIERVSFGDPVLEGRMAVLQDPQESAAPNFEELYVLQAKYTKLLRIHVRDALTNQDLDAVKIVRLKAWELDDALHPGVKTPLEVVGQNYSSPFEFVLTEEYFDFETIPCLVHSPGYAWAALPIDLKRGGKHEVALMPSGSLEVQWFGEVPKKARLRLRTTADLEAGVYSESIPGSDSPLVLEDVLPGEYQVTMERGPWYSKRKVFGTANAVVEARKRTQVEFTLQTDVVAKPVKITGRIEIPKAWGITEPRAILYLRDVVQPGSRKSIRLKLKAQPDGESWTFSAGKNQPGSYQLDLVKPDYWHAFTVKEDKEVLMRVPPPLSVAVSIVFDDTGEDVPSARLHWCHRPESGGRSGVLTNGKKDESGRFILNAAQGTVELFASGPAANWLTVEKEVQQDGQEITLRLARTCLLVVPMEGLGEEKLDPDWEKFEWEALDSEGESGGWPSGDPPVFKFTEPGRYRIQMPPLRNFKPIPPFEVDLIRGQQVEHRLQLEPKE